MAKEMMIVFVYDAMKCNKEGEEEEDDPAECVMYFHPAWVSPTQRMALAGQLMGINQFLTTTFSPPCMISLQGGKFVLKRLGKYLLAVGTDRNIQNWILQRRANILESLLKFFHCDLETISNLFNNDRHKFSEKLYQIFETYLPILQYSANLFSSIPTLKLPRSASNVFLEAIQILQNCQETNGNLGGAIFYNNKVVASQLSAEITKQLVLTDSYRIKTPAERITTDFHLPVGVQLLRVYVEESQVKKIIQDINTERSYSHYLTSSAKKTMLNKKSLLKNNSKDQPILSMKRDTSRIFTVPEEEELESTNYRAPILSFSTLSTEVCNSPTKRKDCKLDHPKQTIPTTPSICSTPLKDVNRVLHGTAVSICCTTGESETPSEIPIKSAEIKENDEIPEFVKKALRSKQLNKLKKARNDKFVRYKDIKKSLSLRDIRDLGTNSNCELFKSKKVFNTITDPYYPVFRNDGFLVSQSLYNQHITSHYRDINTAEKCSFASDLRKQCMEFGKECVIEEKKSKGVSRSSMTLPLKPLNVLDSEEGKKSEGNNIFEMRPRRKLEGLQLTPLMSKLSLMADEGTSGFCRETTPNSELSNVTSNFTTANKLKSVKIESRASEEKNCLEKTELFLCGHQNMVLVLLMENGTCSNPELIHSLWQMCVNNLGKIESRLQECLDPLPVIENKELYSVLAVDSEWDTLHRSGLWGVTELEIISTLHRRFMGANWLSEVIARTEDTVMYANQCGKIQVYYQQAISSNTSGGLPTPADLMGIVPLKAKRRVERDHEIIIL